MGKKGREDVHGYPAAGLVVVFYYSGFYLVVWYGSTGVPSGHVLERVDLDRVVVARGRDLADGIEGRVADAQGTEVLAYHRRSSVVAPAGDFPQIPHAHVAVQRGGGEEMRVARVQAETTNLLLGQLVEVWGVGRGGAGVDSAEDAVEAGEVEDVGGHGVDFDAREGFVRGGVLGPVDFGRGGGGEVEEADGGVVR